MIPRTLGTSLLVVSPVCLYAHQETVGNSGRTGSAPSAPWQPNTVIVSSTFNRIFPPGTPRDAINNLGCGLIVD